MALTKSFYDIKQIVFDGQDIESFMSDYNTIPWTGAKDGDNPNQNDYSDIALFMDNSYYKQSSLNNYSSIAIKGSIRTIEPIVTDPLILQVIGVIENVNSTNVTYKSSADHILATVQIQPNSDGIGDFSVMIKPLQQYSCIVIAIKNRGAITTSLKLPNLLQGAVTNDLIANIPNGVSKIGFQGTPFTHLIVNGNQIVVGKSGVYELSHPNLIISTLSVVAQQNKPFVLTLKYKS